MVDSDSSEIESPDIAVAQRPPGYLMAPFGWAAKPLATVLDAEPSLYPVLFSLSRQRMHLIALALAHLPSEPNLSLGQLLICGAPAAVLDAVLGRRPAGLRRALSRLPVSVLPRMSYQHLIELLEDHATAKLIYHRDALPQQYISLLYSVPGPLRRIVIRAVDDNLIRPKGLVDGLRFLAARGAAPSFDAMVANLATIQQPAQLVARIAKLIEELPLPDLIPPGMVAGARRLDGVAEIRRLAKAWKNCLASSYLDGVNDGRSAVYFWPHAQTPAACVVSRHGRVGWVLEDAKGPENAELPPTRLEEIHCAFAAAGIPRDSMIEAIEHAGHAPEFLRHEIWARQNRDAAYEEMYDEFDPGF